MISPIEGCAAAAQYLDRIGAKMRNLFSAVVVKAEFGYEKDVGRIKFYRDGNVRADKGYEPTAAELESIRLEVAAINFPNQQSVKDLSPANMPDMMRDAKDADIFIYRNKDGEVTFVQVRLDLDNGDKRYVPFTYWSDSQWRNLEPEGGLPIYGLEEVRKGDRVFLHEGAKAAKAARLICDEPDHPFSDYFRTGSHVGWIGGVHHVSRTRWGTIADLPGEVIIIPDNDFVGRLKVAEIASRFDCPMFCLRLDSTWPKSWDVADPIPPALWEDVENEDGYTIKSYIGPGFQEMLEPCDWATEEVWFPEGQEPNKPVYKIREQFAQNWVRIQNIEMYAHMSDPDRMWKRDQFNFQVRPYSDVHDTSMLLARVSGNIVDKVTFRPDKPIGLIRVDGDYCLNQYKDIRIKPQAHDGTRTAPFWRFMEYLFPNEEERLVVTRWMATLYARPNVRMGFGLLMLSKMQGIGKSTLLNLIAALVGRKQCSFPGDSMIQSDFNGWLVNKRFIAVHEIYAGQNWKTYNRLKSLITEDVIEANNKHVANYQLPNWSHFAAASNSMEALRIENDDRRWYVPLLATQLYPYYDEIYQWLRGNGLRYLAYDLTQRNDYLTAGDKAPSTEAKMALIDQSMPTDERMILTVAERLRSDECVDVKELWLWLQSEANMRAFINPQRIMSLLREHDYYVADYVIGGRKRSLVWKSEAEAIKAVGEATGDEAERRIATKMRLPSDAFGDNKVM